MNFKIKLFADAADLNFIKEISASGIVKGFTTNPTLMKKAGVRDYKEFSKSVLEAVPSLPVSFEVFADDFDAMEKEARILASWGKNVYVKIPITNTKGASSVPLIEKLLKSGVQVNITAILDLDQAAAVKKVMVKDIPSVVSVFAGKIADTGRDPVPYMKKVVEMFKEYKNVEILWASSREVLNIFQAQESGCHIITVTGDILKKLPLIGKSLKELSLETVNMFYKDANDTGCSIIQNL